MPPWRSIAAAASSKKRDITLPQRLGVEPPGELAVGDDVAEEDGDRLPRLDRGSGSSGAPQAWQNCAPRAFAVPQARRRRRRAGRGRAAAERRRRRRVGDGELERRVVAEDRLLELLQRLARVEAELVDERGARVLVGGERVGLAAGAVEREHQQAAQALAQRVLAHERLELGHGLGVAAEREVGLEPLLERDEAQLLEPADLVAGERLVAEVRERRPAPEPERPAQHVAAPRRVALGEQRAGRVRAAPRTARASSAPGSTRSR